MTRAEIIKVLQAVEEIDPGGYCCAEHDILYVIPEGMTEEQAKRLSDLGCHIDCGSYAVYT